MKNHRKGEASHHPFRSERFYNANSVWYFMIRGGNAKGPFTSREEAENALKKYVETQVRLDQVFHNVAEFPH